MRVVDHSPNIKNSKYKTDFWCAKVNTASEYYNALMYAKTLGAVWINNRPYDYDKAKAQVRGQLHVIVAYNSINGLLEIGIGNKKNAESMEKMIERNRRLG